MRRVIKAFETIKGYCEKHHYCKSGCIFYSNSDGCILQEGKVVSDLELPAKEKGGDSE